MNQALVDKITAAVLYEGYILYPYRPSLKNRQRWAFGGLYPQAYSLAQGGTEAWEMQTQCLVVGGESATLEVKIRFLHLVDRVVGEFVQPLAGLPQGDEPEFRTVDTLQVGERRFQSWQEAVEREIALGESDLKNVLRQPQRKGFSFPARRELEGLRSPAGLVVGALVRQQQPVEGSIELAAERLTEDLSKITVRVRNHTALEDPSRHSRNDALLHALVSTHALLGVRGGEFISLLDPPQVWREAAAGCRNIGTWPVLVGEEGEKSTMLSAPIILYDYPQVAPESPGDLFDSTEIDEILTLRILTLTDEEKREVAAVDERGRAILERTESLAREQLAGLHGIMRGLRPVHGEVAND